MELDFIEEEKDLFLYKKRKTDNLSSNVVTINKDSHIEKQLESIFLAIYQLENFNCLVDQQNLLSTVFPFSLDYAGPELLNEIFKICKSSNETKYEETFDEVTWEVSCKVFEKIIECLLHCVNNINLLKTWSRFQTITLTTNTQSYILKIPGYLRIFEDNVICNDTEPIKIVFFPKIYPDFIYYPRLKLIGNVTFEKLIQEAKRNAILYSKGIDWQKYLINVLDNIFVIRPELDLYTRFFTSVDICIRNTLSELHSAASFYEFNNNFLDNDSEMTLTNLPDNKNQKRMYTENDDNVENTNYHSVPKRIIQPKKYMLKKKQHS